MSLCLFCCFTYRVIIKVFLNSIHWRRQWHPTPVLLPGKSHGWRSLVGCSPWGREELDTTERLHFHFSLSWIGEGDGDSVCVPQLSYPFICLWTPKRSWVIKLCLCWSSLLLSSTHFPIPPFLKQYPEMRVDFLTPLSALGMAPDCPSLISTSHPLGHRSSSGWTQTGAYDS